MNFDFSPLLRYLLRRVVRIAISSGITYQAFCKLLRSVYFEVAAEFEPVNGKPNSDSRVSLLTGLPRRDVRSLRETADAPAAPRPNIERLVLDAWTSSLDFMDANGDMLPLPRTQRQGGARSFDALVEAYVSHVDWESPRVLERRVASLLPGLTLARVDGKSPVEYLDEAQRDLVRTATIPIVVFPPPVPHEVASYWRKELAA